MLSATILKLLIQPPGAMPNLLSMLLRPRRLPRWRGHAPWLLCLSIGLPLCFACGQRSEPPASAEESYYQALLRFRRLRDQQFKTAADSPIPPQHRSQFQGLAYFPINPGLRFSVRLHRLQPADTVWIMTTHGRDRPALKVGYVEFKLNQQSHRLFAYVFLDQPTAAGARLFIPFRDATSGQLTYAGGRYLYLSVTPDDRYVLDFNLASNPACAYGNLDYICPIPPAENTLPVAILAGEKHWKPSPPP